jgi:hypothetical protein
VGRDGADSALIWGKARSNLFLRGGLDRWNQTEDAGEFFVFCHSLKPDIAASRSDVRGGSAIVMPIDLG